MQQVINRTKPKRKKVSNFNIIFQSVYDGGESNNEYFFYLFAQNNKLENHNSIFNMIIIQVGRNSLNLIIKAVYCFEFNSIWPLNPLKILCVDFLRLEQN